MLTRSVAGILCLISAPVWAQLDPTSVLLLRKGAKPPVKEQLDRGRYTIRPGENVEPKRPASTVAPEMPKKPKVIVVESNAESSATATAPAPVIAPAPPTTVVEAPPLTEKVKEMVMGGSEESIEFFRDQLHPEDVRQNLMEVELAPTFVYTESASNYWFRSYSVSAPAFSVAAQIWITPFFGMRGSFINTMDSSVYDASNSRNRASVDQQWFDAGFRWRTFYGASRKATTLSVGLDFSESQFRVPKSATERVSLKTVGAKVSLEATMPRSNSFAWTAGAFIIPRADHKEKATALGIRSGGRDESTVLGLSVGGNHNFSRSSTMFWKLQHSVERNLFEKEASVNDPVTGVKPTGVSVTSGTTMFTFGFRWGH